MSIYGTLTENYIVNGKDVYYNKDKFDSKKINLCFITGHSGSGKSTMASDMESKDIEKYELDDVIWNKERYSMDNFKEYGDLIYTFFKGPGKKYYYTGEELKSGKVKKGVGDKYEERLINDFVNYAISFAKSHKNKQYVIEGVWLYMFISPEKLKDYAVYIKGTSASISSYRATKRDINNDTKNGDKVTVKDRVKMLYIHYKESFENENVIRKYRQYFKNLMKENKNG